MVFNWKIVVWSPEHVQVVALPPGASDLLQRDKAKAETIRSDLKTLARNFRVTAELGLNGVSLRAIGSLPQDSIQKACDELRGLLEYHFPAQSPLQSRRRAVSGFECI